MLDLRKRVIFFKCWILENACFSLKWGISEKKTCDFRVKWKIPEEKKRDFCLNGGFEKAHDFR